jgi:hypothetical protein
MVRVGDRMFCIDDNTIEYSEYNGGRPSKYTECRDLFNAMVDAPLFREAE